MTSKTLRGRFLGRSLRRRQFAGLLLVESRHAAGSRLPRHSHEHAYFCVNYGGVYSEEYGRRRRRCQPGMVVFHPPGECHAEAHETDVATVNVEIDASWLRRIADYAGPLDQPVEFAEDDIASAGLQILGELGRSDEDSALAIEGLTWEVLAAAANPSARRVDTIAPRWLRNARESLDARIGEPASLRAIAEDAGVHPVHFAATFRRFVGCSVGEYARRRRFEYARRKLADCEIPLHQVAAEAGFADQSHLTRTFKRLTGMTPKQYRTFLAFKTRR